MAYLKTSATDYDDLLDKLAIFAVADGWTLSYNSAGPPRQIGIYKDNCYIALGAKVGENPITAGSDYDAVLNAALSTSLTPGNPHYWAHPGSIVTTEADSNRIRVNDLYGSFSNVWFFSDTNYIHVVVQAGGERYTHFGFGILDSLGQTHSNVAWAAGMYYKWWPTAYECHNPSSNYHDFGHLAKESYAQIYIPAGVLPTGYPTTPAIFRTLFCMTLAHTRTNLDRNHWVTNASSILDFTFPIGNQLTTGGNVLYSVPWLYQEGTSHVHLGVLPGIRLANIAQFIPAEELIYGTQTWVIFPWVRKGLKENLNSGGDPIQEANTAEYAWAYKKVV